MARNHKQIKTITMTTHDYELGYKQKLAELKKQTKEQEMKKLTTTQKNNLLTLVIEQIKEDMRDDYLESLEELLNFIPNENLLGYLQEEKANEITEQFIN